MSRSNFSVEIVVDFICGYLLEYRFAGFVFFNSAWQLDVKLLSDRELEKSAYMFVSGYDIYSNK